MLRAAFSPRFLRRAARVKKLAIAGFLSIAPMRMHRAADIS
jgi:hypothetical protein